MCRCSQLLNEVGTVVTPPDSESEAQGNQQHIRVNATQLASDRLRLEARKSYSRVHSVSHPTVSSPFWIVNQSGCLVSMSHLILCDPMGCSMPGPSVLYCLPKVCSNSRPLSQWCHLINSSSAEIRIFSAIKLFQFWQEEGTPDSMILRLKSQILY